MDLHRVRTDVLHDRRKRLLTHLASEPEAPGKLAIFAGQPRPRNYLANAYPFRAESHFLYLTGLHAMGAALVCDGGVWTLYAEAPSADDELWHGPSPSLERLGDVLGVRCRPLGELAEAARGAASLPTSDAGSNLAQSAALGREIRYGQLPLPGDVALAEAMVAVRLVHDGLALARLKEAAEAAREAHLTGMAATEPGLTEHAVRAAMEAVFLRRGCTTSYAPIVTTHGEVLHHHGHGNTMRAGDLLLADVGAETEDGWASDVTRTWPVSGRFSPTQRAVYDVVLAANEAVIQRVKPGARWRDLHLTASRVLARGLVDLGWLRGEPDGLVERGVHALFFPHGLGHLLGLDVHDMEDLGDRAGYAKGRTRSSQFGLSYLRMDRDLVAGMGVTVEPGLYVVPAILKDPRFSELVRAHVDREALARFSDVRGIRIEDDVIVTDTGADVLSRGIPKRPSEVEQAVAA
jgi:Xaa-Pro aminopeptidase